MDEEVQVKVWSKRYFQVNKMGWGCSMLFHLEPEMREKMALAGRMSVCTLQWGRQCRGLEKWALWWPQGRDKTGKTGHRQQRQRWNSGIQMRWCRDGDTELMTPGNGGEGGFKTQRVTALFQTIQANGDVILHSLFELWRLEINKLMWRLLSLSDSVGLWKNKACARASETTR